MKKIAFIFWLLCIVSVLLLSITGCKRTMADKSPAGSFAFILALLMIAFWATHHISKWNTKLEHVNKLDGNVSLIKDDISTIKAFISVYGQNNNPFAQRNSPVSLTPAGVEVSKDLGIEDLIIRHWSEIQKDLSSALKQDCNPYDIQQEAINVASKMQKYFTASELDVIKRYAFQKGHSLTTYDLLIGIHIRDIYFKKNNINIDDVDKYDPNKPTQVA